jgi:hypothetical protein
MGVTPAPASVPSLGAAAPKVSHKRRGYRLPQLCLGERMSVGRISAPPAPAPSVACPLRSCDVPHRMAGGINRSYALAAGPPPCSQPPSRSRLGSSGDWATNGPVFGRPAALAKKANRGWGSRDCWHYKPENGRLTLIKWGPLIKWGGGCVGPSHRWRLLPRSSVPRGDPQGSHLPSGG